MFLVDHPRVVSCPRSDASSVVVSLCRTRKTNKGPNERTNEHNTNVTLLNPPASGHSQSLQDPQSMPRSCERRNDATNEQRTTNNRGPGVQHPTRSKCKSQHNNVCKSTDLQLKISTVHSMSYCLYSPFPIHPFRPFITPLLTCSLALLLALILPQN